jgi:hypothetical protein
LSYVSTDDDFDGVVERFFFVLSSRREEQQQFPEGGPSATPYPTHRPTDAVAVANPVVRNARIKLIIHILFMVTKTDEGISPSWVPKIEFLT